MTLSSAERVETGLQPVQSIWDIVNRRRPYLVLGWRWGQGVIKPPFMVYSKHDLHYDCVYKLMSQGACLPHFIWFVLNKRKILWLIVLSVHSSYWYWKQRWNMLTSMAGMFGGMFGTVSYELPLDNYYVYLWVGCSVYSVGCPVKHTVISQAAIIRRAMCGGNNSGFWGVSVQGH